ncbi:MAG: HEAT repeat domain-containing protein [Verrucomicrobia bacterium]|nr:HEAT repeat domain-containing protein [Verrucomicrobiota bacterium]
MAVAWTREVKNDAGKVNKILCTTLGAATDLQNDGLRRLVVNGLYWGLGLDVPESANVDFVDPYRPLFYGFNGYRGGLRASDHALGKVLPDGTPVAAQDKKTPAKVEKKFSDEPTATPKQNKKAEPKAGKKSSRNEKKDAKPETEADAVPTAPPVKTSLPLQLNPGDHVALIGNSVADRMQHHGWLETLTTARFARHDLVFRNLGFSGDEVGGFLNKVGKDDKSARNFSKVEAEAAAAREASKLDKNLRNRSENFGSNDEWLVKVKADVVFAFFGFNESFAGDAGLPRFRSDLATFIQETRVKNYSGKGAVRLVLFGPLAAEKSRDPNQPDADKLNVNIRKYSAAMAEVAKASDVAFVDLFSVSESQQKQQAQKNQPLTFNTIHLTEAGDKALAPEIFRALFGETAPTGDFAKLRAAINEKNWEWHQRYRTVDGYNVYGGRSKLEFSEPIKTSKTEPEEATGRSKRPPADPNSPKISNYQVMQEEMSQRDVRTANRDRRVWAVAKGGDLKVTDANLPPVTPAPANKHDAEPYLDGREAIAKMTIAKGTKVTLFADEKKFPELINPVQMAWDTKGRLWVAVWPTYPERTPWDKKGDSLLIFEDTNGDGVADKCVTFMDNLNCPTGFQFYKDGVLLVQAPDLLWVRDTNGDDKPDSVERVLGGLDSADSHHTANALCLDPGGATYLSDGVFHRAQTETAAGVVRNIDGAIFRYEPVTHKYERYVAYGFANPHGRVFDYWGNDIITDATGNANYFGPAFSGFIDFPAKHAKMQEFWKRPSRPCPGTGIVSSRHFPDDWQGDFLNLNVIGFRGIFRVDVSEEGSGLKGETTEDLVKSEDQNFRPSSISCAPDGSIYFLDWAQQLIGHMQHHIRDPNRDHGHGRIYRMTYEGRPLLKPVKIHGESIEKLLAALKEPENDVRTRAKIELGKHDSAKVIAATKKWAASLDKGDKDYQHHLAEALWVHQWHNVVDEALLKQQLRSPDYRARAAATRVLCYWRDRVKNSLALLKTQAADEHPRVRLEAIRAASFFRDAAATDVAVAALKFPTDYYIDYTLKETTKQLEPLWRKALAEGQPLAANNPAGLEYLVSSLGNAELLKLPRTEGVQFALLARPGVPDVTRTEALGTLAESRKSTRAAVLLDAIAAAGNKPAAASLARLLPVQATPELKAEAGRVAKLTSSASPDLRQPAWAALTVAEGSIDSVWSRASSSGALADFIASLPLMLDQDLRVKAYDRVKPLLDGSSDAAVRRAAIRAAVSIPKNQAETFAALTVMIQKRELVAAAAQGIRVLPRAAWPKEQAGVAATALVAWAKTVPASARTSEDYIETVQTASDLAGALPADKADALRKELKKLRVAVFVVRTVREQMRYDTPRIVVEAGKPFEIIIENTDFMPHNLVVVTPGSREKVGNLANVMSPETLDSKGRAFTPKTPEVLDGTKLIEAGEKTSLKLTAPNKEGDYEYVCTFPGHWQMMWGQLVVTKDVDAYLAKHPEAAVPAATGGEHKHGKFE